MKVSCKSSSTEAGYPICNQIEFERAAHSLAPKFDEDGIQFLARILDLTANGGLIIEVMEAAQETRDYPAFVKRLAHDYRQEVRLDMMIRVAESTHHRVSDLAAATESMSLKEFKNYLANLHP
ncbi:MAG: hypothetical protein AAGE61_00840 [Pseudomonadota bacterium]